MKAWGLPGWGAETQAGLLSWDRKDGGQEAPAPIQAKAGPRGEGATVSEKVSA